MWEWHSIYVAMKLGLDRSNFVLFLIFTVTFRCGVSCLAIKPPAETCNVFSFNHYQPLELASNAHALLPLMLLVSHKSVVCSSIQFQGEMFVDSVIGYSIQYISPFSSISIRAPRLVSVIKVPRLGGFQSVCQDS